ncbi:hypothetical protein PAHAL_6G100800 [Panicum hallii]|uniref:Rad21/Rec8-like protein N-terminal domain-containing protein n=1 Tax=Panicum hallii TaxID=206008 RepID=A0A2T8IG14_9POAL|nr:hypothetical protein PAHAL_6G100800 [Panicum hallii]
MPSAFAESIMFPEVPIALRLSGHLLLGLIRIYSWKVNYLFLDCNRMVTTIRTTFAAVEIDLLVEVEPAPFDSITLPPTFNLDNLNLDDVISQINTSDNHQKTPDQSTLAEGGEYMMIDLDEDDRVEPSASYLSPYMGPEPFEPETFPRFDDGFGASNTLSDEIPLDPPGNMPENPNIENPPDGAHDPPEIMREAPQEGPGHFTDSVFGNDDPMVVDQDSSPFVQNKVITPPSMDGTSSAGQQLAGIYVPLQTPNTYDLIDDVRPLNSDNQLPELRLEPSPPSPQAQDKKRKREMMFDYEIELDCDYLKEQIDGPADKLLCKRRNIPQTALDMWKFSRTGRKDSSFLLEPLVQGMCTYLHVTYDRNFPRVSDPDAEPNSSEPMADYGGSQDAPSERQLTPKSHENEDTLPEGDLTPKSPGNPDEQPEPQPTLKSPGGAGAAQDGDTLPEFPRFSPVDMPSPIREDDSPFKTVRRTPHSGLGGTGVTEMPQSVRTNSLPGQSTPHSDHMASLFPVNDDYEDQPEIPGLISTPGGISKADTGTTGLGSMSARTGAVALFFKDHVPSTSSDEQPGKFSLSRILEGKVRKQAARMFFETMVLKSYDYIDVQQEEPYADIEISVRPSLAEAKL